MAKKLILLAMAVGALVAFAVPAAASAQQITNAEGNPASEVFAESTNTVTRVGELELRCTTVDLTGQVVTNTPETSLTEFTGEAHGNPFVTPATHEGECATNTGAPINITSITGSIHLSEVTNTASFNYAYDITTPEGALPCGFSGTGTVSYVSGSDEISVVAPVTGSGPEGCPPAGLVEGDFTVLDENEEPAVID